MPRIPYFDENNAFDDYKKLLNHLEDFNLSKMLAHAPTVIKPYLILGRSLLTRTELCPVTRELVIMRVGTKLEAHYEFSQHQRMAQYLKISPEKINAIKETPLDRSQFSDQEFIILELTDDIINNNRASDHHFNQARAILSERSLTELVITIGYYMMTAVFLNNFDIELEPSGQVNPEKILRSG